MAEANKNDTIITLRVNDETPNIKKLVNYFSSIQPEVELDISEQLTTVFEALLSNKTRQTKANRMNELKYT